MSATGLGYSVEIARRVEDQFSAGEIAIGFLAVSTEAV